MSKWEEIFDTNFTTKGYAGTDFGLSISTQLLEVTWETSLIRNSIPGIGTTFQTLLPSS